MTPPIDEESEGYFPESDYEIDEDLSADVLRNPAPLPRSTVDGINNWLVGLQDYDDSVQGPAKGG
ncbi:hypothetical protein M422DRAFT_38506 [Sphaerobolus stellatus SS14]|uniref:Unplaced genomic scaffold SPHSTscaffold_326, whole genome shotgun sequence n=1 Tax=Sphaerobolus stellatus (strain SS14) TaxID=990650 RepID=A0A0C9U9G3_SPHS4|nr:hypothetical protein M422DRAFT_38506 [Sphaerobolus stellatus SS14]